MLRFLAKIGVFLLLLTVPLYFVLLQANGHTDDHYLKFTTPPQQHLILGTSKAAQGMRPEFFKEVLGMDMYNYAFTINHSPYGPTYLRSIKKKVAEGSGERLFVVTVDPWSISTLSQTPNDPIKFYEDGLTVGNMPFVNLKPNPFYFLKNYNYSLLRMMEQQPRRTFLHDDGWLEVTVKMDTTSYGKRYRQKIRDYTKNLKKYNYSTLRVSYLEETVAWLNERGKVYLVRLPVAPRLYEIGNEKVPVFDSLMHTLAPFSEGYLDMNLDTTVTYQTIDGNHLYKPSGKDASLRVARWIASQEGGSAAGAARGTKERRE